MATSGLTAMRSTGATMTLPIYLEHLAGAHADLAISTTLTAALAMR